MLRLSLAECAAVLDAELRGAAGAEAGAALELVGVGIDTRTLESGMLYVAIRGERHDGHDFVAAAERAGARAVLVERALETTLPQLLVDDTRIALGALARHWRSLHRLPVVAITGSNGKTTVKELLTGILAGLGPVLATRGNLNNELGVPLTLFRLGPEHRHAVIEMGASAAGEIAYLASLARPDVGVVTNVGPAHLEGFGSLPGVARAKSELFGALGEEGWAVLNADDAFVDVFRDAAGHRRRCEFGHARGADVRGIPPDERSDEASGEKAAGRGGAEGGAAGTNAGRRAANGREDGAPALTVEVNGERLRVPFPLPGAHNRANALAAIAAARCLGVAEPTIVRGLERAAAVPGRLVTLPARAGATLIDDSYNANPASTRAALAVLAARAGRRHLVLGDMGELGADAASLHAAIGEAAHMAGLDGLWTLGPLAAEAGHAWERCVPDASGGRFADVPALLAALERHLGPDATLLVKGSRSARMERVVEALAAPRAPAEARDGAVPDPRPQTSDGTRSGAPESHS